MALQGLAERIQWAIPGRPAPAVIRDADDLVGIHPARAVIEPSQALMAEQWRGRGVALQPSQTRTTHTWPAEAGGAGVNCLGCNIRPYPTQAKRGDKTIITPSRRAVAQPKRQIAAVSRRHRMDRQARLLEARNPVIRGWSHSVSTVCSRETFEAVDEELRHPRRLWSRLRQPNQSRHGAYQK